MCYFAQVSVGTLFAFTIVAISILILRYIPPETVPLPSSLHESIHSVNLRYSSQYTDVGSAEDISEEKQENDQYPVSVDPSAEYPLIVKEDIKGEDDTDITTVRVIE